MQLEQIQSSIETYTSNLPQAVQAGQGAQFSMLLSLITASEQLKPQQEAAASGAEFKLPETGNKYPNPNDFYSAEVVDGLNRSVNQSRLGDHAYLRSLVDVKAKEPVASQAKADEFEKVALMSAGKLMLDHISASNSQFRASA